MKAILLEGYKRSIRFAIAGFVLGFGAPLAWLSIRLILFRVPDEPLFGQLIDDIAASPQNIMLYSFMCVGTCCVMTVLGYYLGRKEDELQARARELNALNSEMAVQKELFENSFKVLDRSVRNINQISNSIQKTTIRNEALSQCVKGLHEVLGYGKVNLLLADAKRENLTFFAAAGTKDFDVSGVQLPLDHRSGVIAKSFFEKGQYLIEDLTACPDEYRLAEPYDMITPLRSMSFASCPIVVKGEAIGVLVIDDQINGRALNSSDSDTIKLVVDQTAVALTKINLLEATATLTGALGNAFAGVLRMRGVYENNINTLKISVSSMNNGTAHFTAASEAIMESVDETSSSVSEIAMAIEQVTENLDFLAENIDKAVSAMEEINSSIKNVEQNTALSHDISSQVKSQADQGKISVEETISALAEIQKSVELSFAGISRLTENSGRIDSIVGVINDITKRTNLLALNASIIAAQAGEYGKSFGVVADEIRNLSLQTGHSTGEITSIIEDILSDSRLAAKNIAATKDLVLRGVEIGQSMDTSLRGILDKAIRSMNMTLEIKYATGEQAKSVSLVTKSLEDINSMAGQIFNASKEQSNATKSIVRSVESIKEMTQQMVKSTTQQSEDSSEIMHATKVVERMAGEIFDDVENQRVSNEALCHDLGQARSNTN